MEIIELFPVSIGHFRYDKNDELKKIVAGIMQNADEADVNIKQFSKYYFEKSAKFIDHPAVANFKNFLVSAATQYIKDFLEIDSEVILPLCWINVSDAGHRLEKHNHGNSYISASYYLNFDQQHHAPLTFYKSALGNSNPYFDLTPRKYNSYNAGRSELANIQEGDLFIFPSHLQHGYENNLKDGRISIAMNFLPTVVDNDTYKFKISKI